MYFKIGDKVVLFQEGVIEGATLQGGKIEYMIKWRDAGGTMIGFATVNESLLEKPAHELR
jgi:hypothetical protein